MVAGASYESRVPEPGRRCRCTRPAGWWARRRWCCPARVVYGVASRRVFETVRKTLAVLEQLSFDEAFGEPAELRGRSPARPGVLRDAARRVRRETGLVASVGAGSESRSPRSPSGLAKPDGIRVVGRDEERLLLDGLPVRRLWGIGPVAEDKLHRLGIETVGQLAALDGAEVAGISAAPSVRRYMLARGVDDRPVVERAEAKQISAESTFPADLTTPRPAP